MTWLESLDDHVRRLTDFRGREARLDYWGWVISVAIVVGTVATLIVAYLIFADFDDADFERSDFDRTFTRIRSTIIDARLWSLAAFLICISAATARRLHDVGKSATGAMIPAALTVAAFWTFGELFKSQSSGPFATTRMWDADGGELILCGALSLAAVVTSIPVLYALVRNGDAEANEYGPPAGQSVGQA